MGRFVIKKRVSLDFLGDAYKDAYLDLKSIPMIEYQKLIPAMDEVKDDKVRAGEAFVGVIKDKFLGGKFPDEEGKLQDVVADDLDDILDEQTVTECFAYITGQRIDPKSATP